jgi:polysaccharide export outer membrane protein
MARKDQPDRGLIQTGEVSSMRLNIAIIALFVYSAFGQQTKVTVAGASSSYVLGAGDQFSMEIADLEELNGKVHRVDSDGTVTLPLVGRIQAAGLTLAEFEEEIDQKLGSQLKEPHITVTVTETLSQPVTVIGAVNKPGIHQIRGQQSLIDVLSEAGGLRNDAGYRITITRQMDMGDLPVPNAKRDDAEHVMSGEINVGDILEARNQAANIRVYPHDVITVPRAKLVYVMGEVRKSGGFTLEQKESLSVIEALALAEGTTPTAARTRALILRREAGALDRSEIKVDIEKIISGKTSDVALRPDDILLVPNSAGKVIRTRAIEIAIAVGTGVLIWRGL